MDDSRAALESVSRINAYDVEGIVSLMTGDHVFVDSLGNRSARPQIEEGWRQYLVSIRDCRIQVESQVERGNVLAIFGTESGTYVPEGERGAKGCAQMESTGCLTGHHFKGQGKVSEWRVTQTANRSGPK